MADITSIAPDEMGELTKKFIQNKNVNERVSIRLKMKAILDYLSTDTEFPPNPLLKKDPAPTPARDMAMGFPAIGMQANGGVFAQPVQALGPVEPIAQAQRMDNTEILG
jgi:hypothetical protein